MKVWEGEVSWEECNWEIKSKLLRKERKMEIVESQQHCEDGPPEGGGKGQNGECCG